MGFILLNFAQKKGALWIIEKPENRREKTVRCRVSGDGCRVSGVGCQETAPAVNIFQRIWGKLLFRA